MGNTLAFGPFLLDIKQRILQREGQLVPLTPKVVETLILLVENAGRVVDKGTIMRHLWPGVFVVESTLTRNISVLRKALGPDSHYIETLSKRGYRFVAPVSVLPESHGDQMPEKPAEAKRTRHLHVWTAVAALCLVAGVLLVFLRKPAPQFDGSPEARRLALLAAYHWHKLTTPDLDKARAHYQAAVQADPRSASAWAGLADTYLVLAEVGGDRVDVMLPKAVEAAQRAIDLNSNLAAPHSSLALATLLSDFDWRKAELGFEKSLRLDASYIPAYAHYSILLTALRRFDEAELVLRRGLARNPASPLLVFHEGRLHYTAERYETAVAILGKAIDLEPAYDLARYYLALSYGYLGRFDEAMRELRASGRHANLLETEEAWILARSGKPGRAESLLTTRWEEVRRGQSSPIVIPVLAAALGRQEEAIGALESCLPFRSIELLALLSEPRFAPLRGNPRFAALAERVRSAR